MQLRQCNEMKSHQVRIRAVAHRKSVLPHVFGRSKRTAPQLAQKIQDCTVRALRASVHLHESRIKGVNSDDAVAEIKGPKNGNLAKTG